jgi:uncharacterized protein YbjT (DUF2867 family)
MIVVMGAAGNVGRRLSDRLLGEGQPVRVLEHRRSLEELGRRGAEVVTGDQADPGDLGVLLKDAEAALVVLPDVVTDPEFTATRSRMSRAIADALAASGVGHVVALSTSPPASPTPPARRPGSASLRGGCPGSGTATCSCCGRRSTWRTCSPGCR